MIGELDIYDSAVACQERRFPKTALRGGGRSYIYHSAETAEEYSSDRVTVW
jgi:hypothetical protein